MSKFKPNDKGEYKFSDIVSHFTRHVDLQPLEYNLSDFYKGGRYILERRDQIDVYPDTNYFSIYDSPFGVEGTFHLFRCNSPPRSKDGSSYGKNAGLKGAAKGDKVKIYYQDGTEVPESLWPTVSAVYKYNDPQIQVNVANLFPTEDIVADLNASGKQEYADVYVVQIALPQGKHSGNFDVGWKLNEEDEDGVANYDLKKRFSRAKTIMKRDATNHFVKGGSNLLNPSPNIPVDIPSDDDGVEISFKDFKDGYGQLESDRKNTRYKLSKFVQNYAQVSFQTSRDTDYNTNSTHIHEKSSTKTWYNQYQKPAQWQKYQYYTLPYQKSATRRVQVRTGRRSAGSAQSGFSGFFQFSYAFGIDFSSHSVSYWVDVSPTYRQEAYQQTLNTYKFAEGIRLRKYVYWQAPKNFQKKHTQLVEWEVECTRSKTTSKSTSFTASKTTSGTTNYECIRETAFTFWD